MNSKTSKKKALKKKQLNKSPLANKKVEKEKITYNLSLSIFKFSVFFLISIFAFLLTFNESLGEMSYIDRSTIIYSGLAIGLVQSIILTAIFALMKRYHFCSIVFNVLLSLFSVLNLYSFYIVFINDFATLSIVVQILFFLLSVFVACQIFISLKESKWWRYAITATLSFSLLFQTFNLVSNVITDSVLIFEGEKGDTVASNIKIVDFVKKPNIYFISFDAMLAPSIVKETMNLPNIGYQSILDKYQFRWFKNSFSEKSSTAKTLNSVLALDPNYYDQLFEQKRYTTLYRGINPAPLTQILQANGYLTSTYSRDTYFGKNLGPNLDHLVGLPLSLCFNHLATTARKYGFYGYCRWLFNRNILELLGIDFSFINNFYQSPNKYINLVLNDWHKRRKQGKPLFTFTYIISPGHIPPGYKGTDKEFQQFRASYSHRSNKETAPIMNTLIQDIKKNDPNAYIFIFGDHGTSVGYSKLKNVDISSLKTSDGLKQYFVKTQHGIASAFYPASACEEYFAQSSGSIMEKIALPSMVARLLVKCLANGKDPFVNEVDYLLYENDIHHSIDQNLFTKEKPDRFENYIYE